MYQLNLRRKQLWTKMHQAEMQTTTQIITQTTIQTRMLATTQMLTKMQTKMHQTKTVAIQLTTTTDTRKQMGKRPFEVSSFS